MSDNSMNERRQGMTEMKNEIDLIKNDISYIKKFIDDDRAHLKDALDSIRLHRDKVVAIQGYEDRFNDKLDKLNIDMNEIKIRLEEKYVSQDEFRPVRLILYGQVAVMMTSLIAAIVMLVLK